MIPTPGDLNRFWSKTCPEPNTGCVLWTAGLFKNGYGCFYADGRSRIASRVAWATTRGPVPDGLLVLHRCDTPACVNPDHLFLGTDADNIADRDAKGRQARAGRHGSKTRPDRVPHGARHGSRLHPERAARGDRNGARSRPESRARGDRNGARLHPETHVRGERVATAKLTPDAVRTIRGRHAAGATMTQLAAEFGVVKNTISCVVRGRNWSHVA